MEFSNDAPLFGGFGVAFDFLNGFFKSNISSKTVVLEVCKE